ncbi:MAG: PAS domain S-box protein [Luteimonas sp.]
MALLLVLLSAALIAGESTSAASTQILIVSGVVAAFLAAALLGRGIVQGEKRLWASREHWRVTLASIGDAVITTDVEGRVVYLNPVAEHLTGWTSAEASGQTLETVFRIVNESTRETVANPAARALQEGVVVGLVNHTLLIARDGVETPIDDSAAPIRDEQGAISGVVLIFRDVTARRRVEDSLNRARDELEQRVDERTAELARANAFMATLLENLQEGIVACDAEGVLTLFNKATRDFHGLPQQPVPAEHWADHYNLYLGDGITPMRTEEVPLFRALRGEQVRGAEMVIAPADGPPRSLLAYAKALHDADGKVQGAVVSMHDITRRKQAEAALQEAHADLESRVAERTMELGQANDALRREIDVRRQAEEQLRQSETRKTAMFEAALDCIVSTDHEDRIIEFNAAAERTFGHRRADVLGRDMAELLVPAAYRARHRAGMAHYLATGEGPVMDKRLELSALHADGHEFPIELTVTRIPVPGTPVFTAYLRDISDRKRAEAALRESDMRWAGIFEQLHEGFIVGEIIHDAAGKAVDWRYLELNGAWEAMTGLPRESVQGSLLSEVIPGTEPEWVQDFAEVVRTGEPATFLREVAVLGRWYEVHAFRPEPGRFAALFFDISERHRAETVRIESEQRLRFVMDSMPQKIFTAKPDGNIDYFNPQWTQFTGLTFEQIRDWGWKQFIHPDDVDENVRVWQQSLTTGAPFQFEHRFRDVGGEYRWHISRALPLLDDAGNILMWVGSNTDIDEQRKSADALSALAAELSETDRQKSEFISILAHELRNPLAPMSNAVQILQLTGGDPETVRSVTGIMDRQVRQMVRLVDDLLDLSRISRGKIGLRAERMDLVVVLQEAVEAARPAIERGQHDLVFEPPTQPVWLRADPQRLVQVFGNLLNNAAKFSESGGRIAVILEQHEGEAIARVRDTGIGIPEDKLEAIFDMFTQADQSLERSYGGLGIGLTLVRQLVEMHGGSVQVSSAGPRMGSEFVVRLPLAS